MLPTTLCATALPVPNANPSFIVCKKLGLGTTIAGTFVFCGVETIGLEDLRGISIQYV